MSHILWVLFILFFCHKSFCENTWIHAVGIDESNVNQNYDTFYKSAVAFNEECSKSSTKPNCLLYINDNSALRPSTSSFADTIKNNLGTPNALDLKKIIKENLVNSLEKEAAFFKKVLKSKPYSGPTISGKILSMGDALYAIRS